MMLRRWAVGPLSRPGTFRFQSISLKVLVRLSSNFTHNTSRGSSCAFWGIHMNFDLLLFQNYDLFRRFETHFVSGADLEKYWVDYSHIAHTCSLRSLVVLFFRFLDLDLKVDPPL